MIANFDLSITYQSIVLFQDLRIKSSEKLINFSIKHTSMARFTGLPIQLCSSLLDLAQYVSNIGESLIKGVANIFGSPFSEKCKFSKGVKQIFLQFPAKVFCFSVFWVSQTSFEIIIKPLEIFISPIKVLTSIREQSNKGKELLYGICNDIKFDLSKVDPIDTKIIYFIDYFLKNIYT